MKDEMSDELKDLPLVKAPDAIWARIEAELDRPSRATRRLRPAFAWAFALAAMAIIGVTVWYGALRSKPGWDVVRADGSKGKIAVGDWLETGPTAKAVLTVGDIGTVEVQPNTRIKLEAAKPGEQRLKLARGDISATVTAPPRLFIVDTPASTAFDLGCAYTMHADEDGNGLLRVTLGWVSLEWAGRESLVPAGASCRTHAKVGPGTPYFENGGEPALELAISESRVRDTLTLWHLLSRVAPVDRQRVFQRMVQLVPLPQSVSADKALQLDPETLKLWREELAWKW